MKPINLLMVPGAGRSKLGSSEFDEDKMLVIAENHAQPSGRLLAETLLNDPKCEVFFIECPPCPRAAAEAIGNRLEVVQLTEDNKDEILEEAGLSNENAKPTLHDLVDVALKNKKKVYAADIMAHLGWPIGDLATKQKRDAQSARAIANKIKELNGDKSNSKGMLMLWGSGHFSGEKDGLLGDLLKTDGVPYKKLGKSE